MIKNRSQIPLVIVLSFTAAMIGSANSNPPNTMPNNSSSVFELVARLQTEKPNTIDNVNSALGGGKLTLNQTSSHLYSKVYCGTGGPGQAFSSVEVRCPVSGKGTILVTMQIKSTIQLTQKDVIANQKSAPQVVPPSPTQKAGALIYLRFATNEVRVSYGFPLETSAHLVRVVIEYQIGK
jgi:hypothetical protein